MLQSGRANNVIPDSAHLELSVRALDSEVRSLLQQRITEIAHAQAQSFGVKAEIDYRRGYAALVNSKDETDFARQIGTELVGAERVVLQAPPLTGSEDFAFMLEKRPGCYLLIGNGDGDKLGRLHGAQPGLRLPTTPTWPLALHTGRCWRGVTWSERWATPLWKRSRAFW